LMLCIWSLAEVVGVQPVQAHFLGR
jgi:hypothetical protein